MAGDWIKFEHATRNKPEVIEAAEVLGISRREAVGLFVDYFCWLDENLPENRNGFVTHMSRKGVDAALNCAGFAAILERIGWATFDDEGRILGVINANRHNGKSAKTRALGQQRAQKFRSETRNDYVTQKALPEKRREDIKNSSKQNTSSTARAKEGASQAPKVKTVIENLTSKSAPKEGVMRREDQIAYVAAELAKQQKAKP